LTVGHRRFHRRLISNAPPAQKKKIEERTYDPPNVVGGISDPLLRLIFKDHYEVFSRWPVTVIGVAPRFAGRVNGAIAWLPDTLETYLK
jgi:hypothetical protein